MAQVLQALATGLLTGTVYALLGAGFSLIWGVAHVINIVHPALAVGAAYAVYLLAAHGVDPLASLAVVVPLFFLVGVGFHEGVIRPAVRRGGDLVLVSMVLTFGLAAALENVLAAVWGPGPRVVNVAYTGRAVQLRGLVLPITHLAGAGLAAVTIAALYLFLHKTFPGKAVRAVWQNPEGAALCAINLRQVTSLTYGLAIASAGVAGVALALIYSFSPASHLMWLVFVFLVVIVGGVGSLLGAVVAGMLVGALTNLSTLVIPFAWAPFLLFASLGVLLLWRPTGLFRR
ncbi:MAG: branched-chain amino acid ABC transporter permease [Armatimonadota bacterium]|nr:branched-chain amino acid ABC transporter permease [Armatimonadota bacterium]